MDPEELAAFLTALENVDFSTFQVKRGDTVLTITRGVPLPDQTGTNALSLPVATSAAYSAQPVSTESAVAEPTTAKGAIAPRQFAEGAPIAAPMMGTFYSTPRPGEPPFVQVGDTVSEDTVVAIIEVMKLMTPVTAGCSGTVRDVCVSDGELVDFEQTLFIVGA